MDTITIAEVGESGFPGDVGADEVALDGVRLDVDANQVDAVAGLPRPGHVVPRYCATTSSGTLFSATRLTC